DQQFVLFCGPLGLVGFLSDADRHRVTRGAQPIDRNTSLHEFGSGVAAPLEPATHAAGAVAQGAGMLQPSDGLAHFLPPEDLRIGHTWTSPYQTTFGPEITRVPNSTGMGASWEAMGTSLSPIWPGWASCTLGRGASSADSTVVTTQMMIC